MSTLVSTALTLTHAITILINDSLVTTSIVKGILAIEINAGDTSPRE